MSKYFNFAIVASFFGLWIDSFFKNDFQVYLGFILIFSFGILHGANDLLLIKSINQEKKSYSFTKILFYYITIVISGVLLFYYIPAIALMSFIIVSGYHFGEQQWQNLNNLNNYFKYFFQFCYGTFILFLLFYFHPIEVQKIIQEITSVIISINYIVILLKFFGSLLLGFLLYLYIYETNLRKQILLEVFYLLVFTIIFLSSSLIWGFAIFFIIWHSIPSMIDQIKFLHQEVTLNSFKLYFKSAFLYWIVSLFGIAILYFIFKDEKIFNALFFSFLAAITFPHVVVILKMFNRNKSSK